MKLIFVILKKFLSVDVHCAHYLNLYKVYYGTGLSRSADFDISNKNNSNCRVVAKTVHFICKKITTCLSYWMQQNNSNLSFHTNILRKDGTSPIDAHSVTSEDLLLLLGTKIFKLTYSKDLGYPWFIIL